MEGGGRLKHTPRLIVAGIPLCGTTMLWYACQNMPPSGHMPKDYDPLKNDVHKVHSLGPPPHYRGRAVFVFGDPILAVISTRKRRWDQQHFDNCGRPDRRPAKSDIYREDVLRYELMFDGWMRRQRECTVLAIRYERMHHHAGVIREFLSAAGLELHMPQPRKRKTTHDDIPHQDWVAASLTYGSLNRKVLMAPDIGIWTPEDA
jgi:hypothetical protein